MIELFLDSYLKMDIYPFHMPGHKRNPKFLNEAMLFRDVTELSHTDNLYEPSGLIKEAHKRVALAVGSDESAFLTNGSTSGIIAAIAGSCGENDEIIMSRNCHRSALSALVISGAKPVYIYPESFSFGFCGGADPSQIAALFTSHPKAKAVFITSPTYEGLVSDIASISKTAHENGAVLIVDEAHGAHFPFHACFPKPALALGADIVVNSAHKTLPALTQAAAIHRKGLRADWEKIKFYLKAVQTSSPSYILMSSTESLYRRLTEERDIMNSYASLLEEAREAIEGAGGPNILGRELIGKNGVFDMDSGKIILAGVASGFEIERILRDEYKAQLEMSSVGYALAMTSPADVKAGFDRLVDGVRGIGAKKAGKSAASQAESWQPESFFSGKVDSAFTLREAVAMPSEEACVLESEGRICVEFYAEHPPGIPVAAPGERLTRGQILALSKMGLGKVKVARL
ncbi:MAG: aminotransferase class I/II-fold pyridoxal phosphate-dependent enzyme [Clostridiales bacterium]|jgi:lysine decarboxylase|nr:aminotransferase class I/II-fold pyridoxal phosphate-dependent enzyme [Clostridiales bacterium]